MNIDDHRLIDRIKREPFIKLDLELDIHKIIAEYLSVINTHPLKSYRSSNFIVRRFYAKAWQGVALVGTNGDPYYDMSEMTGGPGKPTTISKSCPYTLSAIRSISSNVHNTRARFMKISSGKQLAWHSHVLEHQQPVSLLTVQIPIIVPPSFIYSVVPQHSFKWFFRFSKPERFSTYFSREFEPGEAFVFNSYNYHNVFNNSAEDRVTLMLYCDISDVKFREILIRSIDLMDGNKND